MSKPVYTEQPGGHENPSYQPAQQPAAAPAGGMQQIQMMPPPQYVPTGCPPGLEYLAQVDQILIKQVIELIEVFLNWEANNRYKVLNTMGQQVFFIHEETDCFQRQCCKNGRGFTLHVTDNNNVEVMRIVRPFKCWAGCPWCATPGSCCSLELQVEAPVGQVIGFVKQECSSWKPKLGIYDVNDQMVGLVQGPCCVCNSPCCGDVEFPVTDPTGQHEIGMCGKQWSGMLREYFTDADNFFVKFPVDMDVRIKALYIGAMMMLDFMFFEHKNN